MLDAFDFRSDDLSPDGAFDKYAALYSRGSDVGRGRDPFHAVVNAWRFDGFLLFDRHVSGVTHSRGGRVGLDGLDHLVMTLVLEGLVIGSAESGFDVASAGEIFLTDTTRRSHTEFRHARVITLSVAREAVRAGLGTVSGLHGKVLVAPGNAMLVDYLRSLARNAPTLSSKTLPGLSRALIDLLSAVDQLDVTGSSETARQDYLRRETVERHVAAHLGDRSLSVDALSRATGMSRSALYRLYETEGGMARLIQRRRIDAVRSALDRRETVSLEGLAHRCGFADPRQMSRHFEEITGGSLRAYLQSIAATRPHDSEDSYRRWESWLSEVS